ncbi:helix-turn-helix domain-containing protein [Streptomyces sp. NBC_01456]|uniref:helix-turn-helix domain-containing protein n=1 Tax=unclassified Streptomyces TaxID=2593676 RepID=UPI003FCE7C2F
MLVGERHNGALACHCPRSRAARGSQVQLGPDSVEIHSCPRSWTPYKRCALVGLPTIVGSSTEALMTPARLHLTDSELLRLLMRWAPIGKPLTIRKLAERAGISKSKIHALLSGERVTVTPEIARRICGELSVHEGALFFKPLPSPTGEGIDGGERHEHERAVDADAARGSQELGGHDGSIGPYRRRP